MKNKDGNDVDISVFPPSICEDLRAVAADDARRAGLVSDAQAAHAAIKFLEVHHPAEFSNRLGAQLNDTAARETYFRKLFDEGHPLSPNQPLRLVKAGS